MIEIIKEIVNGRVAGTHLFLVDIEAGKGRFEILLDGDCGVNINECALISRYLHAQLEERNIDTGDYVINISSPGFDRNIEGVRSFKKNVGRRIQVKNGGNKYLKGNLAWVDEEGIILVNAKKPGLGEELKFSEIKEAKIVI